MRVLQLEIESARLYPNVGSTLLLPGNDHELLQVHPVSFNALTTTDSDHFFVSYHCIPLLFACNRALPEHRLETRMLY